MRTTSIWFDVGQYNIAMCLVPIKASTSEVVGRGIVDLRLLEGSLVGPEIFGGIAKKER